MTTAKPSPPDPFACTVHSFKSPTYHSCAYETGSSSSRNALVFIGGLGDGPHTVYYIRKISRELQALESLSYSVFEIRMSSAYAAWGYTSLASDVADLSALVKHLKGLGKEKIVFMGHSTGCQDCMEYTNYEAHGNEPVDGFILQGPVSDREALGKSLTKEQLAESIAAAAEMLAAGKGEEAMPRDKLVGVKTPITAYRWNSLAAPGGDDDFFSSDLPDDKVASFWGKFKKPVLLLPSAEDEHVPKSIDVRKNIDRWMRCCAPGIASELSDLIPGANHTVDQPEAQVWMTDRVIRFLQGLEDQRSSL